MPLSDRLLAAPDDAALRREVEIAKDLGFNGVRIHQKVEDPRYLYWCDHLGLLVWAEMANAYVFSSTAMDRLTREWLEVLARDYSHPCIICWVPINESWGVPNLASDPAQQAFVQSMYYLTKAHDPTRPAISNDGWEYIVGDICGIHDYAHDGNLLRERYGDRAALARTLMDEQPALRAVLLPNHRKGAEPVMVTEFGGLSLRPEPDTPWFGYGTVRNNTEYLAKLKELMHALLDSTGIAGFCYTQLTDTLQETNGLVTAQRVYKFDPRAVRAIMSRAELADTDAPGLEPAQSGPILADGAEFPHAVTDLIDGASAAIPA